MTDITRGSRWAALFAFAFFAGISCGSSVTVGLPATSNSGNCIPFGCPGLFGTTTYQEVYSGAAFPGSFVIEEIDLFNTEDLNGGMPAGGTYKFSLSYTSESPGSLDLTNPANNIGPGSLLFFSGPLPSLSGGELQFPGVPFSYNPALGNLLLTVTISGGTDGSPTLYLDQSQTQAQTGRAYFGTITGGNDAGGLVTQFDSVVPEPGSLVLVLTGLGVVGLRPFVRIRRRT
jgi:hypothetical protein